MSLALLICWSSLNSRLLLPWNWGVTRPRDSKIPWLRSTRLLQSPCCIGMRVERDLEAAWMDITLLESMYIESASVKCNMKTERHLSISPLGTIPVVFL